MFGADGLVMACEESTSSRNGFAAAHAFALVENRPSAFDFRLPFSHQ
jgi:hypothetical protein